MTREAGSRSRPHAQMARPRLASTALASALLFSLASVSCSPAAARFLAGSARDSAPETGPGAVPAGALESRAGSDGEIILLACGDILLARTPGKRAAERGYRHPFQGIRDLVAGADVAFANLETPASYLGSPYPGKPPVVTFRADPATLFGLAWAGFDVLSLANNHMNDYGPRAVEETLEFIDLLGLARCGAGMDLEEARAPAVVEAGGSTLAFLAYAEPIWSVVGALSSEAYLRATRVEERLEGPLPPAPPPLESGNLAGVAPAAIELVAADVRRVRRTLKPDYLFVSIHWGVEHAHYPNAYQRELGRAAIDAGATAVLGHHPHVWQSLERRGGGLIAYSMGNLVFDMAADSTYETAALRLALKGGSIDRVEIVPLSIRRGSYAPEPASAAEAAKRLADLKSWSPECGADISVEGGIGVLRLAGRR